MQPRRRLAYTCNRADLRGFQHDDTTGLPRQPAPAGMRMKQRRTPYRKLSPHQQRIVDRQKELSAVVITLPKTSRTFPTMPRNRMLHCDLCHRVLTATKRQRLPMHHHQSRYTGTNKDLLLYMTPYCINSNGNGEPICWLCRQLRIEDPGFSKSDTYQNHGLCRKCVERSQQPLSTYEEALLVARGRVSV